MDGFFVAKLKKFSNVIPTTPVEQGNIHSCDSIFLQQFPSLTIKSYFVIYLEEETGAPEAPVLTDTTEEKPSKSDKKKIVPGMSGSLKEKIQANGTVGNKKMPNKKAKGKNNLSTGPKKAKIAKMDGDRVKVKEPTVKTADETKQEPKADKKEASRFEKMQRKKPMKANKRMGKNKFKKLKKMLQNQDHMTV